MKAKLSKYRYHFFLILIGMALLTLANGVMHFDAQGIIYPDSESYFEAARNIYVLHIGHNYRPMVMAAISGIPYLFGASDAFIYEFSYYVNLFCWLATALVLFEILKEFLHEKRAFFLALLSFTFIGTLSLVFHLLTENIFILLIALVFYFIQRYYRTRSFFPLAFALSLLVLCMLVRPGVKWLAVLFLLYFFREIYQNYKAKPALLIYTSLLLVLVQCAGIKYQFGNFTISYIDSVTYYNYMGTKAVAYKNGKEFFMATDPRVHYIFSLSPPEIQREARRDLIGQLKNNKEGLLFAYCSDVYDNTISGCFFLTECRNVGNTDYFKGWQDFLFGLSQWQNRIFTMLGLFLAVFYFFRTYRKEPFFSLVAVYIGYTIATSGISCSQGDRFHLVVFPFVLVLLGKWISEKKKTV